MREIKFRAWDDHKKWMIYEPFTIRTCKSGIVELHSPNYLLGRDALMQYTGLKDKNGKEIYEGDILKHKDGKYKIVWNKKEASFYSQSSINYLPLSNAIWYVCKNEVIGNIYENPGLLK